jgi:hypothetical protein
MCTGAEQRVNEKLPKDGRKTSQERMNMNNIWSLYRTGNDFFSTNHCGKHHNSWNIGASPQRGLPIDFRLNAAQVPLKKSSGSLKNSTSLQGI